MPDPPKPAEIAKPKPAPVIPKPVDPPPVEPPPVEPITIPLKTLDATVTTPGTIESTQASNSVSLGPGTGAVPDRGKAQVSEMASGVEPAAVLIVRTAWCAVAKASSR